MRESFKSKQRLSKLYRRASYHLVFRCRMHRRYGVNTGPSFAEVKAELKGIR